MVRRNTSPGSPFEDDEPTSEVTVPQAPPEETPQPKTVRTRVPAPLQRFPVREGLRVTLDAMPAATGEGPTRPYRQEELRELSPDIATDVSPLFDGSRPADGVTERFSRRAVIAPLRSWDGQRSSTIYQQVIDQFAVGVNRRYDPDPGNALRTHVFIWDVTSAMGVEIPHLVDGEELNLKETCAFIRKHCIKQGWIVARTAEVLEAVRKGWPAIALPRDPAVKSIAVVRPDAVDPDGKPRLSAVGIKRGNSLSTREALGVVAVTYLCHR